ncbi:MAG: imidazole glycerol phosphate synthase subunit HisH [Bacteroidia bacterium]
MKVAIIKYNAGNVRSIEFALNRLGIVPVITDEPGELLSADKIIFPGVGEAGSAMTYLRERKLDEVIRNLRQPLLGICLGMQLLCEYSEESETVCLGIFRQAVKRFPAGRKVPQIGWNRINGQSDQLFAGLIKSEYMYFVHGYYAGMSEETIATTEYGFEYSSALKRNNFYGVQFHPEKSGASGQIILENFLKI